ncbi:Kexin [Neolecta irregularis DAH-3]|uniref:Kexin n=1 Tax=Neolecta irregularis (strain DAH-3) TaxID=1198029 RepID=A0A1U7LV55_NEOID|nr:Kexin [Neolecta irregularis DAH-3]|eukprot:OLL26524.1 Kexin [Neolecta irregularis DAH-3]
MRSLKALLLAESLFVSLIAKSLNLPRPEHYSVRDHYVVHLKDEYPELVAEVFDLELVGPLPNLNDHYIFASPTVQDGYDYVQHYKNVLQRRSDVSHLHKRAANSILWSAKQSLKQRVKRDLGSLYSEDNKSGNTLKKRNLPDIEEIKKQFEINDPIFGDQWHLVNTVQQGHDLNVTGVWADGVTGKGVVVALIDDGIDYNHPDLTDNFFREGSHDFNDNDNEPLPVLFDDYHGTRCAGEIAAVKNDVCGIGVAFHSKVSAIRMLSGPVADVDEIAAINYEFHKNHIYSCSWGPPDNGQSMEGPSDLIVRGVINGIQNGRDGKGSIFVFASGNGGRSFDNCNFDGYTNSIFSITVGAIDREGKHPVYSEQCCAQLIVTYSSGDTDHIHTTDVKNKCTQFHGGTSAAAPLAAGVLALALSVRPELTWRDMQHLTVQSAIEINSDDEDWQMTANGRRFNHKFGYGKIDAGALVAAARNYTLKKAPSWYHSQVQEVGQDILQGSDGAKSIITVTKENLAQVNLANVEHVTVTVNIDHESRGKVAIRLISPHGVISRLAEKREFDMSDEGFKDWRMMSVMHWGEPGVGEWTLQVLGDMEIRHKGVFKDWKISLWGESIDESLAVPYELPGASEKEAKTPLVSGSIVSGIPTTTQSASGIMGGTTEASTTEMASSTIITPNSNSTNITTHTEGSLTEFEGLQSHTAHHVQETLPSSEEPMLGQHHPNMKDPSMKILFGGIVLFSVFLLFVLAIWVNYRRMRRSIGLVDEYEFNQLSNDQDDGMESSTSGNARTLYDAFGRDSDEGKSFYDLGGEGSDEDE